MRDVARTGFLRRNERPDAGRDEPLPIGSGQSCSQPRTVRHMLRLLEVEPGQRVLDVGSGSGWTTALLAHLVGPQGSVIGVELEPDLAAWGASNLSRQGVPWASIRPSAPDVLGAPRDAPFERILVSAEATELPEPLLSQLAVDGLLVIPVRGSMLRVRRVADGPPEITTHGFFRFVPLR